MAQITSGSRHKSQRVDLIPGLNTLRFMLAIWVMLVHYRYFIVWSEVDLSPSQMPLYRFLRWFYNNGAYPVPLFWAVSGAVFAVAYPRGISFDVKQFIIARISRIFPLHWFLLTFCIAIKIINLILFEEATGLTVSNVIINFFLLQRWQSITDESINGPSWSISVELIAYTVFACFRRFENDIVTILIICTSAIFLKFDHEFAYSPFMCICLFFTTRLLVVQLQSLSLRQKIISTLFMIALAILALKMFPIFSVLLIAPVIVATINVIYSSCPWIPDPAKPAELTYGMYLIHMPIMQVIFIIVRILNVKPSIYFHPFLLIAYITFVLILSRMSFSYFENPIRYRIRKLFSIASPV